MSPLHHGLTADSYTGVRMPLVIQGVAYDGSLVEVQGTRMVTLWPNRPILAPHSPTLTPTVGPSVEVQGTRMVTLWPNRPILGLYS